MSTWLLLFLSVNCSFQLIKQIHTNTIGNEQFMGYQDVVNSKIYPYSIPKDTPDPTDKDTILTLARFTVDAYYEPSDPKWINVPGWNVSASFGWDKSGIRGYLFQDLARNLVVIVIKGTSLATPIGSGPTAKLDKFNDNLMFSCCCAKAGWEWTPICSCPLTSSTCSMSCLLKESNFSGSYYRLAQTIFLAVKELFPTQSIWMAGHSLGGALASLVALTNNVPAFAYEAPGDLLYAHRLGLLPNQDVDLFLQNKHIYHFGNDKDPIYLGECTGVGSSCYWLDYALESKCHVGYECIVH
jgi:lipase ATG15